MNQLPPRRNQCLCPYHKCTRKVEHDGMHYAPFCKICDEICGEVEQLIEFANINEGKRKEKLNEWN